MVHIWNQSLVLLVNDEIAKIIDYVNKFDHTQSKEKLSLTTLQNEVYFKIDQEFSLFERFHFVPN